MAYARIVTRERGTIIRTVKLGELATIQAVNQLAALLDSIIAPDNDILKVEVDYTGCTDEG